MGSEKKKTFFLSLLSLLFSQLTQLNFRHPLFLPPTPRREKNPNSPNTMSRFAIICSLVLAALAGVNSQAANWGSAAGNNTAQALANAIARATESTAVKIITTENAVNNLQKGLNTTAIAAAGVNVSLLSP